MYLEMAARRRRGKGRRGMSGMGILTSSTRSDLDGVWRAVGAVESIEVSFRSG